MARGRKPKPVEQRIAEGNPGKRALPEPITFKPDEDISIPPDHLDDSAKEFWRNAVPVLNEVGLLSAIDRPALEMAATAYARFKQAGAMITADGHLTEGSQGQPVEHPSLATERNAMGVFLRFAEQYALTPVARTRLGLAELQRRSMAQEMDDKLGEPELIEA